MKGDLTIGSLFSGIGGLELGLERAGVGRVIWQVEKDEYCRAVLAKHWPDATRYEDVKDVGRANLVPVDVICGGYPCQPFSSAGARLGQDDARHLWPEYARIIRELRPRYAVLENVAAHLSLGFGNVLGDLADLGYDAEWSCIQAADVGAPHLRDRLFVLAYTNGRCCGEFTSSPRHGRTILAEGIERLVRRSRRSEDHLGHADIAPADAHAATSASRGAARESGWWAVEPDVGRLVDGISPRLVERPLRALGNAVVPQVAEVVGQVILALEAERLARIA